MSNRKVLAIVGMPGSGKSLISEYLKESGYPIVHFGNIVVGELKRRGLDLNPNNEQFVREDLRQKNGMDAIAQIALPVINSILVDGGIVIIDGLYSFSEYKTLKAIFMYDLVVIAVHCSPTLRHIRLASRNERALSKSEAVNRDFMEIERIEKAGPIALADYMVINESTEQDAIRQFENILKRILENN